MQYMHKGPCSDLHSDILAHLLDRKKKTFLTIFSSHKV